MHKILGKFARKSKRENNIYIKLGRTNLTEWGRWKKNKNLVCILPHKGTKMIGIWGTAEEIRGIKEGAINRNTSCAYL